MQTQVTNNKKSSHKAKVKKKETNMQLDLSKLFQYKFMIQNQFRVYGPSKSRISLLAKEGATQPLLASIDPKTWDAEFKIREELEFLANPELIKYLEKHNITDPIQRLLKDVANHEIGHWAFPKNSKFGCPYDRPKYYLSFISPIFDELKKSGQFDVAKCKVLSKRLANAISDVIDNFNVATVLNENNKQFCGQFLFWYLQGQEVGQYSPEYSFFVKMNMALIGSSDDYRLLQRFMFESPELGQAVSRLEKIFTSSAILDMDSWENLARAYTREVLRFLEDEPPQHQYSAGDKTAKPMQGGDQDQSGQGSGQQGDQSDQDTGHGTQDTESGTPDTEPGNGEKDQATGPGKEELGKELDSKEKEQIMMGRSAGQGIPFYIKTEEALDAYYNGLAKRIKIKTPEGSLPQARYPLIPLVRERFDPTVHSIEDAHSGKLFVDPVRRRLIPSVIKSRIEVDIPLRKEKRNLPEFLCALLDSSVSMMGQGNKAIVPWGDQSFYHYGLLTFWGILRYFELERISTRMKISGAIFSDVTLEAKGIAELKKLLLNPTTGGTRLDIRKVMDALANSKQAVFSMISDGDILNWDSIKEEFIKLARKHQFFMIQIGKHSDTSRDLLSAGFTVKQVDGYSDIAGLAIDLTREGYHGAIRKNLEKEATKYKNW
jgi:hypothetical protein